MFNENDRPLSKRDHLIAALRVLTTTPTTLAYLAATDPKGLAQARAALHAAGVPGNEPQEEPNELSRHAAALIAYKPLKPFVDPKPQPLATLLCSYPGCQNRPTDRGRCGLHPLQFGEMTPPDEASS